MVMAVETALLVRWPSNDRGHRYGENKKAKWNNLYL